MLARMRLAELAEGVPGARIESGAETEIVQVLQDSRRAGPGDLFVAVSGLTVDGHSFAADAAARGAAVALQRRVTLPAGAAVVIVPSTRTALAELAAVLLGRPARQLRVAGVTGTDGKTTTTHMASHVLETAGIRTGSMSTIAFHVGAATDHNESGQTTIEAPDLQAWLARMAAEKIEEVVLEVTSHALVQERVGACDFDIVAVTYVGRDHLDYHSSWNDYVAAKARLIDLCAAGAGKGIPKTAILNGDDASYELFSARPIERRWTYSLKSRARSPPPPGPPGPPAPPRPLQLLRRSRPARAGGPRPAILPLRRLRPFGRCPPQRAGRAPAIDQRPAADRFREHGAQRP